MTYSRFAQLWTALITDRPQPAHPNPIVMPGSSEKTIDALVAASNGDFDVFNEIERRLFSP